MKTRGENSRLIVCAVFVAVFFGLLAVSTCRANYNYPWSWSVDPITDGDGSIVTFTLTSEVDLDTSTIQWGDFVWFLYSPATNATWEDTSMSTLSPHVVKLRLIGTHGDWWTIQVAVRQGYIKDTTGRWLWGSEPSQKYTQDSVQPIPTFGRANRSIVSGKDWLVFDVNYGENIEGEMEPSDVILQPMVGAPDGKVDCTTYISRVSPTTWRVYCTDWAGVSGTRFRPFVLFGAEQDQAGNLSQGAGSEWSVVYKGTKKAR